MDMKKILQAMDGTSAKPVEGSDAMAKFVRVVKEANLNQPAVLPTASSLGGYSNGFLERIVVTNTAQKGVTPQQALQELKARVGNQDPHDPAPSPAFVKKYLTKKLEEGTSPHKVALPVQMAMQHYQKAANATVRKDRLIDKYFTEADAAITQRKAEKRALINQYASVIAERVMMKESKLDERSTSEKQARTMAAAAHNPEFAKKVGIKTSVAKEFNQKDKGTALLSNAMKGKKKKVKEAGEAGWGRSGMAGVGLQSIDELSTELLGKYKKAAGADAKKADSEGNYKRGDKRFSGIVKATKKQFANDEKGVAEGLEQLLSLRNKIDEAIQQLNKQ
jgi:hypothetical protein